MPATGSIATNSAPSPSSARVSLPVPGGQIDDDALGADVQLVGQPRDRRLRVAGAPALVVGRAALKAAARPPRGIAVTAPPPARSARAATPPSPASPSRRSMRASQPRSVRAFSTDGQRRWTSTSKLGRCSKAQLLGILAAGLPDERGDLRDGVLLGGRDVEVLVLAGRGGHRGDDPVGDVVDVGEGARLLARPEDLQRPLARRAPWR